MYAGIDTLAKNDNAYKAFLLANRAMFMTVYTVVIAFYFGTQTQKISDAVDKTLKGE